MSLHWKIHRIMSDNERAVLAAMVGAAIASGSWEDEQALRVRFEALCMDSFTLHDIQWIIRN